MPRRKLPSLNAISTFEEVAMHRSCSVAASRLGLSQSAVSKQIRVIEDFVGVPLFSRTKTGMVPNDAGARLLGSLRPVIDDIERICERAARETTDRKIVIVRSLAAVADRWLLPRLGQFFAEHPNIDVQFSTFLVNSEFDRGGEEIEIRFGTGPWMDADATPILGSTRLLIAPPDLPPDTPLDALLTLPQLVHAQSPGVWREFYTAQGLPRPEEPRTRRIFDVTHILVRAVRAGLGVALVPDFFVEEELAAGHVVNPRGLRMESRARYHLVVPHRAKPMSAAASILHDWILREARKDGEPVPDVR